MQGCWEEAHFPLECKQVPKWNEKCKEDGGLSGWIKAGIAKAGEGKNTDGVKPCPNCGAYIEKNGACPYMRCGGHAHSTNQESVSAGIACGVEFCWVCMEIIKPGESHRCNSFKGKKGTSKSDAAAKQSEIDYLSHYYERYEHHHGARKYTDRDRATQRENYSLLSTDSAASAAVDPKYLLEAVEIVIDARRDLKWSYAYAFFLKDSSAKSFFEFLQGDLEQDVENLAKLLEHGVPGLSADYEERAVHKTQVSSRMSGVRQKLDNLEYHAAQDFAQDAGGKSAAVESQEAAGDWLDRRRRRARKATSVAPRADPALAARAVEPQLPAKVACLSCTFVNDAGTAACQMCGSELPGAGAVAAQAAETCPAWATPCRNGAACAQRGDTMHANAYWHPSS